MIDYLKKNYIYVIFLCFIFILAILIRFFTYIDARPLWHDEAPVALTVIKNGLYNILTYPIKNQKAPFLFWFLAKLSGNIGGFNEISLRFFPFLFSLISIGVFYIFSKEILQEKLCILFANLLFAINYRLIYFSQELKQYSGDILLFMTSVLVCAKLLQKEFKIKQAIIFLIFSTFIMLSSFPSCFVIVAFILYKFCVSNKFERIYLSVSSTVWLVLSALYYKFFLLGLYKMEIRDFSDYWATGFITINNIGEILLNFYKYFLHPINQLTPIVVLIMILTAAGAVILYKRNPKIDILIGISLIIALLASVLKIYPLFERTSVYLIPLLILLFVKTLDNKYSKRILPFFFVSLILIMLYWNQKYSCWLNLNKSFEKWNGRETLNHIKQNYKQDEIIMVNDLSLTQFEYYEQYLNFNPQNVIVYNLREKSQEEAFDYLNNLEKGKVYWFYNIFTGKEFMDLKYVDEWLNSHSVQVEETLYNKKSSIFKLKKIK